MSDPPGTEALQRQLLQEIDAARDSGNTRRLFDAYLRYLQSFPETGWVWNNAGLVASALGDRRAAEQCFLRALRTPGYAEHHKTHSNLSRLYLAEDRVDAIDHGLEAVRLDPQFGTGWLNLGNALRRGGRAPEAVRAFEHAIACGQPVAPTTMLQARRQSCLWDGVDTLERDVLQTAIDTPEKLSPFIFFAYTAADGMRQRAYAEAYARAEYGEGPQPWSRPSGRKIRLGYLSADFGEHATTYLLVKTIENHDRARFDVIGLSIGPPREGAMSDRIQRAFDEYIDLFACSDEEAVTRIRQAGIDILIDLKGYTNGCRPRIVAQRPAPVQINYLGWPGTMGARFIDYIIADRIVAPDPAEFSEKVLYVGCYQPTDPKRQASSPTTRDALGLPHDAVVLASMNAPWKITPAMFDVWAQILRQAPNALLWQLGADESRDGLLQEARKRGIADRLILAPGVQQPDHLARLAHADLALDTSPCGGHTTTSDLLWAGVPVITLAGDNFCSRVAASLVSAAGLPELVSTTTEQYVRLALDLIRDSSRRAALKSRLAAARRGPGLFDNAHYTRQLEGVYLRAIGGI